MYAVYTVFLFNVEDCSSEYFITQNSVIILCPIVVFLFQELYIIVLQLLMHHPPPLL